MIRPMSIGVVVTSYFSGLPKLSRPYCPTPITPSLTFQLNDFATILLPVPPCLESTILCTFAETVCLAGRLPEQLNPSQPLTMQKYISLLHREMYRLCTIIRTLTIIRGPLSSSPREGSIEPDIIPSSQNMMNHAIRIRNHSVNAFFV